MIKIYNECKDKEITLPQLQLHKTLPQPQLQLSVDDKVIYIKAVNDNGTQIANIWTCQNGFAGFAKECIIMKNYSTNWADWGKLGEFIKLI